MASNFKYDVVSLIELVESRPCLWDKTNENNKNKILRDKSWQEIFQYLEDSYEQLSQGEKKKTGDIIMNKWSNIRDSFLRSLRTKSGQSSKKSYVYSEHLQFLLKIAQKDEIESNYYSQAGIEDNSTEGEELTEPQKSPPPSSSSSRYAPKSTSQMQPTPSTSYEHRFQSKRKLDVIEREILSELKKGKQSVEPSSGNASFCHHTRSDQEMLLLSFVPFIRDMSETELMDLQIEIVTTIKKIKQRRTSNNLSSQQQHINPPSFPLQHVNIPMSSPAISLSDSYQSSHQSFDYQSPSPSNQMKYQQQEQPALTYMTNYSGSNKFQQLFDQTKD